MSVLKMSCQQQMDDMPTLQMFLSNWPLLLLTHSSTFLIMQMIFANHQRYVFKMLSGE